MLFQKFSVQEHNIIKMFRSLWSDKPGLISWLSHTGCGAEAAYPNCLPYPTGLSWRLNVMHIAGNFILKSRCSVNINSFPFFPKTSPRDFNGLSFTWNCITGGILDGWLLETHYHSRLFFNTWGLTLALSNENFGKKKKEENSICTFLSKVIWISDTS